MPRGKKKKVEVVEEEVAEVKTQLDEEKDTAPVSVGPTLKEELEALHAEMKKHAINSIGDVEVKISRL